MPDMFKHIAPQLIVVAIFTCLSSLSVFSKELDGGESAYSFMNIPTSSIIYGLGGVNISTVDADDVGTTDQNPSLLGPEFGSQIQLNYMRWLGSGNFAGLKGCSAAGEHGAWGASLQYFGYGSIPNTDATGTILGEYSPSDISFSAIYSHDLFSRLRGGFAIKAIFSQYGDYSAVALGADLGLNYYVMERELSLSLVVSSLGGQLKRFQNTYEKLPTDVRIGLTKLLGESPILLNITAWNMTKWQLPVVSSKTDKTFFANLMRHLVVGLEVVPSKKFNFAVGYNYNTRAEMATYSRNILSGISVAGGIKLNAFGFNLALAQPHAGATSLMINFTTNIYDLTH